MRYVRLTGGEPLLHPGIISLVESLAAMKSLNEVALTTNGQSLESKADALRRAGLSRVNVSLDTLDPRRFAGLTRGGDVARTLAGIEAAVAAGLTPVRLNVVAQRGLNDDEIVDIASWGMANSCVVRFLEAMPIGPLQESANQHLVTAKEILASLAERFTLRPIDCRAGQPATDYSAHGDGIAGTVGVIASVSQPFCAECRRLRVTARGRLVTCLFEDAHFDFSRFWDGQSLDTDGARAMLDQAIASKPKTGSASQCLTMMSLGG